MSQEQRKPEPEETTFGEILRYARELNARRQSEKIRSCFEGSENRPLETFLTVEDIAWMKKIHILVEVPHE